MGKRFKKTKAWAKTYVTLKVAVGLSLGLIGLAKVLGFSPKWVLILEAVLKIAGAFA